MFDVYRDAKRHFLILITGAAIPAAYSSNKWRKSRKRILSVKRRD